MIFAEESKKELLICNNCFEDIPFQLDSIRGDNSFIHECDGSKLIHLIFLCYTLTPFSYFVVRQLLPFLSIH
jgi:hypothetical protein